RNEMRGLADLQAPLRDLDDRRLDRRAGAAQDVRVHLRVESDGGGDARVVGIALPQERDDPLLRLRRFEDLIEERRLPLLRLGRCCLRLVACCCGHLFSPLAKLRRANSPKCAAAAASYARAASVSFTKRPRRFLAPFTLISAAHFRR